MEWPDNLLHSLATGDCVLVIGAGFSRNSKTPREPYSSPPSWKNLLEELMAHLPDYLGQHDGQEGGHAQALLDAEDYLGAAQALEQEFTSRSRRKEFRDLIKAKVEGHPKNSFEAGECHSLLDDLQPRIIITTNYDRILEHHFKAGFEVHQYDSETIANSIRLGKEIILKLHGDANNSQGIVITRLDFTRLRREGRHALATLEALLLTRTVLFLGYGLGDPDIQLLLENQFGMNGHQPGHYILVKENSVYPTKRSIYAEAFGVEVLEYPERDNYLGFQEALRDLVGQVAGTRSELGFAETV